MKFSSTYIFPQTCFTTKVPLIAFSKKSGFATVVKFFNMIHLTLNSSLDLNV